MNETFTKLKNDGLKLLKNKKNIKASELLEKALTIQHEKEVEEALLEASYKAIWDSYGGKNYEKMERNANISINLLNKEEYKNPLRLAKSYNGLSIALYTLGKGRIEYNLKAKKIYDKLLSDESMSLYQKKIITKSKIYNDIGIIINLGLAGNIDEPTLLCEENIALCLKYDLTLELGVTYKVYGELLNYFDEFEKSLMYFREALRVLLPKKDNSSYRHHIGDIYLKVSANLLSRDEISKALASVDKAYPYLKDVGKNEYRFYSVRGSILEYYGELESASDYYTKAFDILLNLKTFLQTESNIDGFLRKEDRESTFKNAIRIQYKLGRIQKALELLEKYRGKEFIEKVLKGKTDALMGIPVGLLNERDRIEKEIASILNNRKLPGVNKSERLSKLEDELYFCEEKITKNKKVYKLFGKSINNELVNIYHKIKSRLETNQVVISYFYHTDGIHITVIRAKECISEFVEISNINLEEVLRNYLRYIRRFINVKSSMKILTYFQEQISQYLLEPIQEYLNDDEEVIIIPFEMLHLFPLHIIFLDKYPNLKLSFMSSLASLLYITPDYTKLNSICIFADPRNNLPNIKTEVETIPKFFDDGKVLFREDATKEAFMENWDKYDALHYSGHFRYKEDKPLYSYIECSDNEKITLSKIYELSSEKVSFLSLGGCSSGLLKIYKGEELTGMIKGFFYAGIKSILATLWDVEDKSASEFLITFYEQIQKHNGDKKRALSYTYNKMKEKYPHPFFYAPFILYEGFYH